MAVAQMAMDLPAIAIEWLILAGSIGWYSSKIKRQTMHTVCGLSFDLEPGNVRIQWIHACARRASCVAEVPVKRQRLG
jgi:hypothetical protein